MVILVDLMSALGDMLLTTPAIQKLKQRNPAPFIIALVRPSNADALRNHPYIDEVIVYHKKKGLSSIVQVIQLAAHLRKHRIDQAIIFEGKPRGALLSWLGNTKTIIGTIGATNHRRWASLFINKPVVLPSDIQHHTDIYLSIIGEEPGIVDKRIVMSDYRLPHLIRVNQLLTNLGFQEEDKYVAICVRGTYSLKNWPPEYFTALIAEINKKYGLKVLITGAPGDESYVDNVITSQIADFCYNLAGKTNLHELQVIIHKAVVFITVDTGAMHLAASTQTPVVAIFGSTSPSIFGPVRPNGEDVTVLYNNLSCSPCTKQEGACPEHLCLRGIKVENVFDAASVYIERRL